jgi:hypothetical protein
MGRRTDPCPCARCGRFGTHREVNGLKLEEMTPATFKKASGG